MAIVADGMKSLCDVLRVPLAASRTLPSGSDTVASCLEAYIPLYTFSARPVQRSAKLARVDSVPTLPDFFAETRCDSPLPPGAMAPFGRNTMPIEDCDGGSGSFNDLPLDIHHHHHGGSGNEPVWHRPGSPMVDMAVPVVPTLDSAEPNIDSYCIKKAALLGGASAAAPTAAAAVTCGPAAHRSLPRRNASDVFPAWLQTIHGGDGGGDAAVVPNRSLLDVALMALWEDRADRGMFRYDVSQCPTRVLPYGRGFVAQLNEGRATKKRPTEFSMDRVMQPYNPAKFNFTKAAVAEALVAFCPLYDTTRTASTRGGHLDLASPAPLVVPPTAPLAEVAVTAGAAVYDKSRSPHLVFINVSPIDHGHVLLVPRVLGQLPQALSAETVLLALQFSRELDSPHLRVGYNSLGAFATINHLHFHSYNLPLTLPCESAATASLPDGLAVPWAEEPAAAGRKRGRAPNARAGGGVRIRRLVDYPVNGFVVEAASGDGVGGGGGALGLFEEEEEEEEDALESVAAVVGRAAERMQAANQPFNLLVTERGRRVFVFPQCYAERQAAGVVPGELLDTGVNPAAFEIAGHLVLKRAEDYDSADEAWAARLLSQVSLDEERFMAVAALCFGDGCGDTEVPFNE